MVAGDSATCSGHRLFSHATGILLLAAEAAWAIGQKDPQEDSWKIWWVHSHHSASLVLHWLGRSFFALGRSFASTTTLMSSNWRGDRAEAAAFLSWAFCMLLSCKLGDLALWRPCQVWWLGGRPWGDFYSKWIGHGVSKKQQQSGYGGVSWCIIPQFYPQPWVPKSSTVRRESPIPWGRINIQVYLCQ